MWNLKNKANKYNKTETYSDIENKLVIISGEREGEGQDRGRELRVKTTLYETNYKDILYSMGKYSSYFITLNGKQYKYYITKLYT